jgi:hypothetical protein
MVKRRINSGCKMADSKDGEEAVKHFTLFRKKVSTKIYLMLTF